MDQKADIKSTTVEGEKTEIRYDESLDNVEKYFLNHKTFLEKLQDLSDLPKKLYDLLFGKHKSDK